MSAGKGRLPEIRGTVIKIKCRPFLHKYIISYMLGSRRGYRQCTVPYCIVNAAVSEGAARTDLRKNVVSWLSYVIVHGIVGLRKVDSGQ